MIYHRYSKRSSCGDSGGRLPGRYHGDDSPKHGDAFRPDLQVVWQAMTAPLTICRAVDTVSAPRPQACDCLPQRCTGQEPEQVAVEAKREEESAIGLDAFGGSWRTGTAHCTAFESQELGLDFGTNWAPTYTAREQPGEPGLHVPVRLGLPGLRHSGTIVESQSYLPMPRWHRPGSFHVWHRTCLRGALDVAAIW